MSKGKSGSKSNYFSMHSHSSYSTLDGLGEIKDMVAQAVANRQPALALTDHGSMAGCTQLYKQCMAAGIKPFLGFEGYLIDPRFEGTLEESGEKAKRFHFGIVALNLRGYQGLVKLLSKCHTRPRFHRYARTSLGDLQKFAKKYGKDIAFTTGCFFGWFQQTLIHEGKKQATRVLVALSKMFPNLFVEVQNHSIVHEEVSDEPYVLDVINDDLLVEEIIKIAKKLDLPVIATQDSHYIAEDQKSAHAVMKRMTYGGMNEFPGDSFHLASTEWVKDHYTKEQWKLFEKSYQKLLDLHDLKIPPLDVYKPDVPTMFENSQSRLENATRKALKKYLKAQAVAVDGKKWKQYFTQLEYELAVIRDLGMSGYFIIVDEFVKWCRREKICIEARGSATGSLVCFTLKVTQADPIFYHLDFDRFLSRDRIKPPDIDIDIEDMRRGEALAYFRKLHNAVQIGTYSKMGFTFDPETGEEKGSILRSWQQSKRMHCETEAWDAEKADAERSGRKPVKARATAEGKKEFAKHYGWIQDIEQVKEVSSKDYKGLRKLSKIRAYKSYGTHAGGVLLSGDHIKIEDYVPTMLVASSDTRVTQYDMDDVEEYGLTKVDVLGQTSLTTMRICQELIGREDPTDFTWIPDNDSAALRACRSGRTFTGIFHQEGYAKSKGCKQLGVRSIKDLILMQALYMPGCLDVAPGQKLSQKDLYLRMRNNPDARRSIKYLNDDFESVLQETYGAVVFQEQVINIMRRLGMDIFGINKFFKVVKDSGKGATERNLARMAEIREEFDRLCKKKKIDPDKAWAQTASFVTYGFNRAHATGYGLRTYRTAYLKTHYPLEYMNALLIAWGGRDKEKNYIRECREVDIRLLSPDVNISGASWTIDKEKKAIRKGLIAVTGVGEPTADAIHSQAPFTSMVDLCTRVNVSGTKAFMTPVKGKDNMVTGELKGAVLALANAGALKSLGVKPQK